jgi:hypothetical protein
MMKKLIITTALGLVLLVGTQQALAFNNCKGQMNGQMNGSRNGMTSVMEDLTNDQRAELHKQRQALLETGVARSEIRSAMQEQLKEWGVDAPMNRGNNRGNNKGYKKGRKNKSNRGQGYGGDRFQNLSPEQQKELTALRASCREEGLTPQKGREACGELFASWGMEAPSPQGQRGQGLRNGNRGRGGQDYQGHRNGNRGRGGQDFQGRRAHRLFIDELTNDQRAELHKERKRMQEAGEAPSAIREMHEKKLSAWGFDSQVN